MATVQHPADATYKQVVDDDKLEDWLAQGWVQSDEELEVLSTKTSAEEFIEERDAAAEEAAEPVNPHAPDGGNPPDAPPVGEPVGKPAKPSRGTSSSTPAQPAAGEVN